MRTRWLASLGLVLAACAAPSDDPRDLALRALEQAPAVDGHNDLALRFWDGERFDPERFDLASSQAGSTSLARWRAGGFGASFVTVGSLDEEAPLAGVIACIRLFELLAERHSDALGIARTPDEARALMDDGKLAWILHLEGAEQLEGSHAALGTLHDLGVRSVGLVHDRTNELADSATDAARHGGLSPAGEAFVLELQRLGILVDLAHASDDTVGDVLALGPAPPIASHVALRSLAPTPRNLSDGALAAIAAHGGIAMIDFAPYHVSAEFARWYEAGEDVWRTLQRDHGADPAAARSAMQAWETEHAPPATSMRDVIRHLERARELAGPGALGIGSDFESLAFTIPELDDVSDLPALFRGLGERGWTEGELRALASENLLRVWDAAYAARERPDPR